MPKPECTEEIDVESMDFGRLVRRVVEGPLYVFCGQQLLCAYLRPSDIDRARHAGAS